MQDEKRNARINKHSSDVVVKWHSQVRWNLEEKSLPGRPTAVMVASRNYLYWDGGGGAAYNNTPACSA